MRPLAPPSPRRPGVAGRPVAKRGPAPPRRRRPPLSFSKWPAAMSAAGLLGCVWWRSRPACCTRACRKGAGCVQAPPPGPNRAHWQALGSCTFRSIAFPPRPALAGANASAEAARDLNVHLGSQRAAARVYVEPAQHPLHGRACKPRRGRRARRRHSPGGAAARRQDGRKADHWRAFHPEGRGG